MNCRFLVRLITCLLLVFCTSSFSIARADSLAELYPELSNVHEDTYVSTGVESSFKFLENAVGPIAITICGLAVLLSAILGKYRHAVGFGLVTIVALSIRYFIDLVTSGGGIFFMGICFCLVGILFFFWKTPGREDNNKRSNASQKLNLSQADSRGAELNFHTQALTEINRFNSETGVSRLAQEGYSKGYTGTKLF